MLDLSSFHLTRYGLDRTRDETIMTVPSQSETASCIGLHTRRHLLQLFMQGATGDSALIYHDFGWFSLDFEQHHPLY